MRISLLTSAFVAVAALAGLSGGLGDAQAHVTADPNEAAADSWFRTALRVSHGCEGSDTLAVKVKLPEGVSFVKPQMKAGWEITVTMRELETPRESPYGEITEVVDEIEWRGGPLPDPYFDEFGIAMKLPDAVGETLYFRTVQECAEGTHRWISIPGPDENWGDLDEPAPFIRLTPGS